MIADHGGEDIAQLVGDLRQERAGKAGFRHRAQIAAFVGPPPHGRAAAEAAKAFQGVFGEKVVDHHDRRIAFSPAGRDLFGIGGIDRRPRHARTRFQTETVIVDALRRQPVALFGIVTLLVRHVTLLRDRLVAQGHFGMMAINRHAFIDAPDFAQDRGLSGQGGGIVRLQRQDLVQRSKRFGEILCDLEVSGALLPEIGFAFAGFGFAEQFHRLQKRDPPLGRDRLARRDLQRGVETFQRLLETLRGHQRAAPSQPAGRQARGQRNRFVETFQCPGELALGVERRAAIEPGLQMAGQEGEGAVIACDGVRAASAFLQGDAAIDPGFGCARRKRDKPVEGGKRHGGTSQLEQNHGAIVKRVGMVRRPRQGPVEGREGILAAARRGQKHALQDEGLGEARVDRQGFIDGHQGLALPLLLELHQGQPMLQLRIGRGFFHDPAIQFLRFGKLAVAVQQLRLVEQGLQGHGVTLSQPGNKTNHSAVCLDRGRKRAHLEGFSRRPG